MISEIIIHDEPTVPEIRIERAKKFIADTFNVRVELKGNIFEKMDDQRCRRIASTRVFDLKNRYKEHVPSMDEIRAERENRDMSEKKTMTIYDGFELQEAIAEDISTTQETLHIVITNRLIATFDEGDFRYHARAIIGSNPAIISTTGIIEAPAKPKRYYVELMTDFSKEGIGEIRERYMGEFLEYHDSRLNEIIEGYMLQAIVYYGTGEAFCQNRQCRLFNAHWQKDLLRLQIEKKKVCQRHLKIIDQIKNRQDDF